MTIDMVLRVLMLCGYTQNAYVYRGRLGAIRRTLGDKDYELVFIDPPHIVDLPTTNSSDFDSSATGTSAFTPEDTPRAWWFAEGPENDRTFAKLDETLVLLREVIEKQGPFQGVMGFSQGAALAGMLAALVERPHLHPTFEGMEPSPFRFAIACCGFIPADKMVKSWFSPPIKTPTLHVLGRTDTIVGDDRSVPFVHVFENARLEWHDGGHHTPSKPAWKKFFKAYMDLFANGGAGAAGVAILPGPSNTSDSVDSGLASRA